MEQEKSSSGKQAESKAREDRLKAALKANMGRRKAQARARTQETSAAKEGKSDIEGKG